VTCSEVPHLSGHPYDFNNFKYFFNRRSERAAPVNASYLSIDLPRNDDLRSVGHTFLLRVDSRRNKLPAGYWSEAICQFPFIFQQEQMTMEVRDPDPNARGWTTATHELNQNEPDSRRLDKDAPGMESQFRVIFDHSYEAIIIHTLDGAIIDVNDRMLEFYALRRAEALQCTIADISGAASPVNELPGRWQKVLAGEKQLFEWQAKRPHDGHLFDVEVFLRRIEIGERPYVLAAVRDITDRKRTENALRESEQRYRSLVENSPDAICVHIEGRMVFVNPSMARLVRATTPDDMIGHSIWEHVHPDYREAVTIRIHQAAAGVPPKPRELRVICRDGLEVEVEAVSMAVPFAGRNAVQSIIRDITERKRSQERLQLAEFSIESSGLPTFWFDRQSYVVRVNEAACRALGYTREELCTLRLQDFDPNFPSLEHWEKTWHSIQNRKRYETIETLHRRKDGTLFPVEVSSSHIHHAGKEYVYSFVRDISERERAEAEKEQLLAQLLQAQKMEAVGRLAGGVAHDFNNMLSVICGYAELAKNKLSTHDPLYRDLQEISKAANRSVDLTRQLLAFSRRQIIAPRALNLNKIIVESEKMLHRLVGEDIEIDFSPRVDLWTVNADPTQIDQILVNLTVNARDAMPDGGKITITTDNIILDSFDNRKPVDLSGGEYVVLAISDSGSGMDQSVLEHIFEPFFTTKGDGKGTGLGLSTVYGIARQNGGSVAVRSAPGQGSVFELFLPRHFGPLSEPAAKNFMQPLTGRETILVVEDDAQISELCQAFLSRFGYKVLTANKPGEAIILCEKHPEQIHLLVTDVVMPTMNGKELSLRISRIKPGIKILFMSGYTADAIAERGILSEGLNFIQKPFPMEAFLTKIKEILKD
jgi:two-component system, cell cycle sensor histidine kinase and response regulator CckA